VISDSDQRILDYIAKRRAKYALKEVKVIKNVEEKVDFDKFDDDDLQLKDPFGDIILTQTQVYANTLQED
jgi:hypothetical protein